MSDNQRLDQLLTKLTDLTNTVKGRAGDATIDKDRIADEFKSLHQQIADIQAKTNMDNAPVRRVPGQDVGPIDSGAVKSTNRYFRNVKSIEKDGYFRDGGTKAKAIDLWLAKRMLDMQNAKAVKAISGAEHLRPASDDLNEVIKALTSTGSGAGDELVPTNMAGELWDDFFLASRVVSTMNQINMPSNPFDIPLGLGDVTWYKGGENSAVSESTPSTAKSTLTATELVTEQNWSYTLDEDAAVAMAPAIRMRLAQSGAEIMDAFALNADSTSASSGNINSDDAAPGSNAYYLADGQDGIRHQWLVDNTAMNDDEAGALTDATITAALAGMGKYAVDPMKLVIFCDVATYLNGFLSTGSGAPGEYVSTLDKFGPDAIIRTGQLASYRGIPIVVSASHLLAQDDGKVNSAGSNTKGSLSIVNASMWYVGFMRRLLIETDVDIRKRQYYIVSSMREAIGTHGTRSTNTHTAGIRNITV